MENKVGAKWEPETTVYLEKVQPMFELIAMMYSIFFFFFVGLVYGSWLSETNK